MKDDTISRQAAIEAFDGAKVDEQDCTEYDIGYNDGIDFAVSRLSVLPSAQPEERTNKRTETRACDLIDRQEANGMTLDEAIIHAEEVYKNKKCDAEEARLQEQDKYADECIECATEHLQLAEWLKELKDYRERIPSYEAGYNDAKREIALSGEYQRAYERGKKDAEQTRWIPCGEKLPEDIKPVIVTWKNNDPKSYYQYIVGKHFIGTAHYLNGKWFWYSSTTEDLLAEYGRCDGEEFDEAIEVVAWMPLPEPYKENKDASI